MSLDEEYDTFEVAKAAAALLLDTTQHDCLNAFCPLINGPCKPDCHCCVAASYVVKSVSCSSNRYRIIHKPAYCDNAMFTGVRYEG